MDNQTIAVRITEDGQIPLPEQVRKDLRGRYPKHPWPEDPTQAVAQRGLKRRR